ncbi:hypothetical protein N4G58_03665 [Edwardsiella piscicida]|nr:hypothetical protein N4G58_03665 [Edwardsiella piscicida]
MMPDSVVSVATDLLANQVPGFDEATFWRDAQQKAVGRLSADMQQARDKTFWESGQGFGEAWGDPRSYFAGAVESLPGMVVSMIPAMRLAKLTYSAKVAQGVAATEAAASAARVARLTGSISEGCWPEARHPVRLKRPFMPCRMMCCSIRRRRRTCWPPG